MEHMVVELTSADISKTLDAIISHGIEIYDAEKVGDLSLRFLIRTEHRAALEKLVDRRGDALRVLYIRSGWKTVQGLARHCLLILGVIFLLFLTVYLPTRVLFIQVTGNALVPSNRILEEAEKSGIVFWADRGALRSERIKNALLDAIPQLQWVGVNTSGCVATISVRERSETQQTQDPVIGSIVAARDGVVSEITVVNGTAACKIGQAVREGEVLISGYTDCGISILATRAEGEVFAETARTIGAVTPDFQTVREAMRDQEIKIGLRIGKNRINFYNDSGILDSTCVKMYSEYYLTLPGGLQLPFALIVEQWQYYNCSIEAVEAQAAELTLRSSASRYLLSQMIAGQVLQGQETVEGYTLWGNYICREMIGQIRYEEIIQKNGKDYGENR